MAKGKLSFFLFSLVAFILFVNVASAILTHGDSVNIDTSIKNTYINGSNINLTTTTCSGTDKVSAINNATGTVTCSADQGTINTTEQLQDAIGTGFTANLTYDDANNLFDINPTNILNWLFGFFYTKTDINNFNTSYLTTFNQTVNDSINNYILFVNSTNGVGGSYNDAWINQTIFNKSTILGFNYYNVTTIPNFALLSQLNNGTYITNLILNNGSYLNIAETDSLAYNGTLVAINILNNGSYLNPASSDSFVGNYSRFLTHINWSEAMNGTLFQTVNWNATNTSYAQLIVLNNGSYLNVAETDPKWSANYTNLLTDCPAGNYSYGIFVNGSFKCRTDVSGGGVADVWVNETGEDWNRTQFIVPNINNSYTLGNTTKRYATLYAIALDFYTQITTSQIADLLITTVKLSNFAVTSVKIAFGAVNASHISEGAINTTHILDNTITGIDTSANFNTTYDTRYTTTSYVDTQNTSQTNYINVQNTSQTNYINFQNTSVTNALVTKLALSGGNMTGNINMTANINITFNGNGNQIWSNITCLQLKGSTVTMLIC